MHRFSIIFLLHACLVDIAVAGAAGLLEPTLATHTGPWYAPGAPAIESLWQSGQPGQRLQLRGRVVNTTGLPVAGALVELWHTDAHGNYPPLRASRTTNARGGFGISTVLPGHHLGYRARHIHFVISHPAHRRLVTRIYFEGDVNLDEAPFPELAVFVEESELDGRSVLFADIQFVLASGGGGADGE